MRIAILGATGVIGGMTLEVCRMLGSSCRVVGISCGNQVGKLRDLASEFGVEWVMCGDGSRGHDIAWGSGICCLRCEEELVEAVSGDGIDVLVCAVSGTSGFRPVIGALRAGKRVALASKEILVLAGEAVMSAARGGGGELLPVDSEHCALFQCLDGQKPEDVSRLILTASGGPFRNRPRSEFGSITAAETLAHPVWRMGAKITVDSATMMNKALEVIEAKWLFGVAEDQIDVVVHPQAIVHSMVEFKDNGLLAQLACPDMRLPIQYCLTYPKRIPGLCPKMDFSKLLKLTFEAPDTDKFPALRLAHEVLRKGGAMGAVFNAADQVAVDQFLKGKISFPEISELVETTLKRYSHYKDEHSWEGALQVHQEILETLPQA